MNDQNSAKDIAAVPDRAPSEADLDPTSAPSVDSAVTKSDDKGSVSLKDMLTTGVSLVALTVSLTSAYISYSSWKDMSQVQTIQNQYETFNTFSRQAVDD